MLWTTFYAFVSTVLGIVSLMVFKPGFAGSLTAVAVAIAVGSGAGAVIRRWPSTPR